MEGDHGLGHVVTGGICVESAEDVISSLDEVYEPVGIGSSTGCGEAEELGMDYLAADDIDGGFTQDDGYGAGSGDGEVAAVLAGSWCHAFEGAQGGALQFGADWLVMFSEK